MSAHLLQLPEELQAIILSDVVGADKSFTSLPPCASPKTLFSSRSGMLLASRTTHALYCSVLWRHMLAPGTIFAVVMKDLDFSGIMKPFQLSLRIKSKNLIGLRGKLVQQGQLQLRYDYIDLEYNVRDNEDCKCCRMVARSIVVLLRWTQFCDREGLPPVSVFRQPEECRMAEDGPCRYTSRLLEVAFGEECSTDAGELGRLYRVTCSAQHYTKRGHLRTIRSGVWYL